MGKRAARALWLQATTSKAVTAWLIVKTIIMDVAMAASKKAFDVLVAEEQLADPSFQAQWQRLAPAREFASTLLHYRAKHKLSQRALARKLGVSQPRVVKLESGEHNPGVDTIINVVRQLRVEFVLDVAPANRKPVLVTARAQKREAIAHNDVSVVAASSV
jgi:DNA-binding XRE family transcriptional regulator